MDINVSAAIDEARKKHYVEFKKKLGMCLYPAAFADEYSWLRVNEALEVLDVFTSRYLTSAIETIVKEINAQSAD